MKIKSLFTHPGVILMLYPFFIFGPQNNILFFWKYTAYAWPYNGSG